MKTFTLLLATLVAISALAPSYAVIYASSNSAIGTPGGDRFQHQIGLDYALDILEKGSSSFWYAFAQQNEIDRKNVTAITVTITQGMTGISNNVNGDIFVNSNYIGNFSGDVKKEFTGIVYYELARALQWDGHGRAPTGLLTGIADFFRLKAGYASKQWVRFGEGIRWDEGFDVTARFLEYCDAEYEGMVVFLNSWMKFGYSANVFEEYTGKSVDELWYEYVAKYGRRE